MTTPERREESLATLLGGRRGALDATLPPVAFVAGWLLSGVVVGAVLRQRTRWRRDPALLRAYGRGSWVWVGQYVLRIAVLFPLWYAGQVTALGVAQAALSWPLVAACLAVSWWVIRRSLPPDHPGLRHPIAPSPPQPA